MTARFRLLNWRTSKHTFAQKWRPALLGDCNLDGVVNFQDIQPFIDVLSSQSFLAQADCNQDGMVNFLDIQPFIDILSQQ